MWGKILGSVAALAVALGILLPLLARPANCGGNSAALNACQSYLLALRIWEADNPGQSFYFSQANEEVQKTFLQLAGANWLRSNKLLAKTEGIRLETNQTSGVLIVCDQPFNNVPQKWIGKAPFTHAAGYANGEVRLISPEEFRKLDLTGFVDLLELRRREVAKSE